MADGLATRVEKTLRGYVPAEVWFGDYRPELQEREFTIKDIPAPPFPGRLTLVCPRPLAALTPTGPDREAARVGCEVALENENTHRRLAGKCFGGFDVPGLFVRRTPPK